MVGSTRLLLASGAVICGVAGVASDVRADVSDIMGIWAEPDCTTGQRVKLINGLGILDFVPVGDAIQLQINMFEGEPRVSAEGTVQATVVNSNIQQKFEIELAIEDGRLDGVMERCNQAPPAVQWVYGEALAGFNLAGRMAIICADEGSAPCLYALFEFVDVSGDASLSQAEVARMFRIVGFYVGYFSQPKALVSSKEVLLPVAVAGAFGPLAAETAIKGMDYDDNGRLSLEELLQDRGDIGGLEAATLALEPAAVQGMLQVAAAAIPPLMQMLGAFIP